MSLSETLPGIVLLKALRGEAAQDALLQLPQLPQPPADDVESGFCSLSTASSDDLCLVSVDSTDLELSSDALVGVSMVPDFVFQSDAQARWEQRLRRESTIKACITRAEPHFRSQIRTIAMRVAKRHVHHGLWPVLCQGLRSPGSPFALLSRDLLRSIGRQALSLRADELTERAAREKMKRSHNPPEPAGAPAASPHPSPTS